MQDEKPQFTENSDQRVKKRRAKVNDYYPHWIEQFIESEPSLAHLKRFKRKWEPPQGRVIFYSRVKPDHGRGGGHNRTQTKQGISEYQRRKKAEETKRNGRMGGVAPGKYSGSNRAKRTG